MLETAIKLRDSWHRTVLRLREELHGMGLVNTSPWVDQDSLTRVLEFQKACRETHVRWKEYLGDNPDRSEYHDDIGSIEHHETAIKGYDDTIELLESLQGETESRTSA